jgi:hypothetical protein
MTARASCNAKGENSMIRKAEILRPVARRGGCEKRRFFDVAPVVS